MTFKTIKQTINPTQVILKLCSSRNVAFTNVVVIFLTTAKWTGSTGVWKAVLYSSAELSASVCWWGLCSGVGMSESVPLRSPPTFQGCSRARTDAPFTSNYLTSGYFLRILSFTSRGLQIWVFLAGSCNRLNSHPKPMYSLGGEWTNKYWEIFHEQESFPTSSWVFKYNFWRHVWTSNNTGLYLIPRI